MKCSSKFSLITHHIIFTNLFTTHLFIILYISAHTMSQQICKMFARGNGQHCTVKTKVGKAQFVSAITPIAHLVC